MKTTLPKLNDRQKEALIFLGLNGPQTSFDLGKHLNSKGLLNSRKASNMAMSMAGAAVARTLKAIGLVTQDFGCSVRPMWIAVPGKEIGK